ncbi:hypothetical protein [Streptomyces sp. NPDC059708]|uniref:hypothetical protein n=1 Tax=Streptomyces sp. NPDC059708 TaxID=3346916 RepID=UPI00367BECA0
MRTTGFKSGQRVFDKGREEHGEVVKVYPYGGLLRLVNRNGFEWVAAQEQCTIATRPRAPITLATPEPFVVPPGTVPHENTPPSDLRIGDYVLFQGRAALIRDLIGKGFGPGKTMVFDNGKARPAKPLERVYRVPSR